MTDEFIVISNQTGHGLTPLVSVVIAAYKNAAFLNQAVQSVLQQNFHDYEIIVVDDASGEDTVRDYVLPPHAKLIVQKERLRTAAARNAGIRASTGKYVALLDQDDIWLPEKLRRQVEMMESHPEWALVYCHYTPVDESLSPLPPERKPRENVPDALRMMIRGCFIRTPSTILFRRDVAEQAGLFDESVIGASDWDFYLRLARTHGFGVSPESLVLYRMHPQQLHRNSELMRTAKFKIYEKTLEWVTNERPRMVSHVRRYYCRVLRQAAKSRIRRDNPGAAKEFIYRAIRMWPWNIRSYGLLFSAAAASRRCKRRKEGTGGNSTL